MEEIIKLALLIFNKITWSKIGPTNVGIHGTSSGIIFDYFFK